jgi:hypothetical protein
VTGLLRRATWWFLTYGSVGCLWMVANLDYRNRNQPEWLRTGEAIATLDESSPDPAPAPFAASERMAALAVTGLPPD